MALDPLELFLPDEPATKRAGHCLGQAIISLAVNSLFVALRGDLGAGKTTLCQGLGEALGAPPGEVKSPTFALAHEHRGQIGFSHLDLFRLENDPAREFIEAGLDERLEGICLVEWPERLPDSFWPDQRLELTLSRPPAGEGRTLTGRGLTEEAQSVYAFSRQLFLSMGNKTCA
jgi:tRNA threonylcarbamoyladenosine biosynthesis protein TsaE